MADFKDPHPRSPGDSGGIDDDVYGLKDEDELGGGEEGQDPDKPASDLVDDEEEPAGPDGARTKPGSAPAAPAPLPRLWKVAPETDSDRPVRKSARAREPERPKPPEQPPQARPLRSEPAPRRRSPEPEKPPPTAPSSRGHRQEGAEIERVGSVKKLSEKQQEKTSRAERRAQRREDAQRNDRSGRNGSSSGDSEKKKLIEETPQFDTYEARQRARIIMGVFAAAVCVVILVFFVPQWLPQSGPEEPDPGDTAVANAPQGQQPQATREQLEHEARSLFERARDAAKHGDAKLAVSLLERVVSTYPNSQAAVQAKEALARPERNLPLFVDAPVVVASEAQGKAQPQPPSPTVVEATAPTMPKPGTEQVGLVPPVNPAEETPGTTATPAVEESPAPIGHPLPRGFRARPGTTVHETGWALEIIGDRDGAPMVLVPGGEFIMGTDEGDATERPAHVVFVSTFYVDQHEVTVRQFDLFQKEIGRRIDRVRALERDGTPEPTSDKFPVVMVNGKEAKDYATWAGKRLPTEAQWEKAARGPDGRVFPWGNEPARWSTKRDTRQIEPILSQAGDVSPYGAYDMAGNAWEWTKDWYDPRYFVLVQKQRQSDPTGPVNPSSRVHQLTVKGGSKTWTATKREGQKWDTHFPFVGFRCVLPVEGPDNAFEPPPKPAAPAGGPTQPGAPNVVVPPPF